MNGDGRKGATRGISAWKALVGVFVLGVLAFLFVLVATDPQDNVTLVETGLRTEPSGARFVTGTFRNNTDRSYAHVQVEIDLLKADGNVVGRTVANTTNLAGGETWSFEAPILREDAARFRVVKLTCRRDSRDPETPSEGEKPICALGRHVEVQ